MKIALEKVEPAQIEKRSFEIIGEELGGRSFPKLHEPIIKRCIHTSADFDYSRQPGLLRACGGNSSRCAEAGRSDHH